MILLLFFTLGLFSLTCLNYSLLIFENVKSKLSISKQMPASPVTVLLKIFTKNLYLIVNLTKHLILILYSICFLLTILKTTSRPLYIAFSILIIAFISFFITFTSKLLSKLFLKKTVYFSSVISSFYIYVSLPITYPFFLISKKISKETSILNFLKDISINKLIDPKILNFLMTFKEKEAREVMIPRINVFCVPYDATINETIETIYDKGFSRIPVYKESQDDIVGVLMYKDILKIYTGKNKEKLSDTPIHQLMKPVIYAPENKKISKLLQEFKTKKIHLGIIVNEYGSMEGIITIEDILEEIVGEIQDEYDIEEEDNKFQKTTNGTWILDAQLSIIDIEKNLNIKIPHSPEYETIGGFIFHKAGAIPAKGWSLHLDEFELEVLNSDEKSIEKVKITPINNKEV